MPVYDLTYRRANLPRLVRSAFGPVFLQSLRYGFRSRWTKGIFVAAWLPALVFCSMIYVRNSFAGRMEGEGPNASFVLGLRQFLIFFQIEQVWLLILACAVGAGLLAEDRRANALELYFSRPLTRLEYLGGKYAALAAILFGVTGLPAVFVWAFDVLSAPDWSRFRETWDWPLRFAGYGAVASGATALFMLALSAIAKRGLHAAVYFAIVYALSPLLAQILFVLTDAKAVRAIGYQPALNAIGREIFGLAARRWDPPARSACTVVLLAAAMSLVALWRRVEPSEVVR